MTDLQDTVTDQKGWFERITEKIPLYKGYKDKEDRREADTLLREHLVKLLGEQRQKAEDVASQMLTGAGMMQLDDIGRANTRLQTLIDKVDTAAQGYAGLFDAVKIKEDELDILYEFDQNMMQQVDEISAAIDSIQAAIDQDDGDSIPATVRRYTKTVTDTSALFDHRKDAILGLS